MRAWWSELKRRNVVRMAVAYCALCWLLLQIADLLMPTFGIPIWVMRALVLLAVLGFPLALLFAWTYAWTAQGLQREVSAEPASPSATPLHCAPQVPPIAASIAVLPLVNMSSDKEQDYFSDGLSEELLNLLAQVPELHVAGRTSSFSFKDTQATIAQIGQVLNVATVLEGSVRKSGAQVRITAQLIETRSGYHLWSQTYDRQLTDIFAVQDEIAVAVVAALKLKLLPAHQPSHAGHHVPGPDAYNHFLLGRQFLNRATEEGFRRACDEYAKALALEPDYAAALAGLALAEAYSADYTATDAQLLELRHRARASAEAAVLRDPELGEAYTARAVLRFVFELDWDGGASDFRQALHFNPGDVMTLWQYSRLLAAQGKMTEALAQAQAATRLDPLSAQAWEIQSRYQIALGDFTGAQTALARALDIAPEHGRAPAGMGLLHLLQGDAAAADSWYARTDNITFRLSGQAMAAYSGGRETASMQALNELIDAEAHTSAYQIAEILAWRNQRDAAFEWLQRAIAQRDAGIQYIKYDPALRHLRSDPRYREVLQQIGLPISA